ncbi:unnamed protein product [Mytilus edulis]|uniref:Uncharacterized protein n=1 Tax=Mytilus edulis TaxID=6550 RepID=A0A8S3QEZ2_MYTED|nr:unnamed protein product [Mytilus edulis]
MALMTTLFKRLNIPLAKHKVVGPCTVIEYLGIILDTEKMETRLPLDKTSRISEFIKKFLNRQSCTKRELLQLLGHLNFAMRVIIPGRSFVSYLISLSTTVKDLKDKIYLTDECRTDLRFWYSFLVNWNGINMFYDSDYTSVRDIELYTDAASTIGYGGYFKGKWFCSPWPDDLNSPCEKKFSMAFLELYPIVVAAILWGHSWTTKRILFRCDNEATVHIVNKGRSRCLLIMKLMRTLTLYASRAVQDTCTFSGQSTSQVPASLTSNVALKSTVSDLWRHVLSTRTSQTYKVGYRAYTAFLANNGVVWLDPLFVKENGNALDRDFFIRSLRHVLDICGYNSSLYNGHSFRIGASTSAGSVNIQDHLIKTLGRGINEGFDTMIKCTDLPTLECKNNFSARSQPLSVRELINKECEKGFLSGPYKIPPFNYYRVSPLGLAVGKYSGKKRLILDLSAPHDDDDNCSINDLISKEDCSMTYVRIDDAIKVIRKLGRFSLCSKFDIEAAFKQLARAVQDTCTFSGQSTSQVPASLTSNVALKSTVSDLWRHVLSTRTSQTYKVGYRAYTAFLANNGVVWLGKPMPPISEDILIYFVAHCYKNLRLLHTTIKLYLCGIRFYYIQSNCDHPFDYTNESTLLRLNMIMRAVKRIQGEHNSKPRLPITFQVLGRICNSLRAGVFSTFTDCMLETACTVAFFGFLRCGEFTVSKHFDSTVNLSVTDVEILDSYAILHLKTSKTDPFRKGVSIQLHKSDHTICPFSAVQKYIAIRKGREASFCFSDPLFVKENGNALDRDFFIRSLRHVLDICGYNSSLYNGHSFRIGASTSAGSVNIQDHLIKTLGRWTSDSYCRYIRISMTLFEKYRSL